MMGHLCQYNLAISFEPYPFLVKIKTVQLSNTRVPRVPVSSTWATLLKITASQTDLAIIPMVANFLSIGFIFVSILTRNIPVVWFPVDPLWQECYVLDAHFASRRRLLLVLKITNIIYMSTSTTFLFFPEENQSPDLQRDETMYF